MEVPEEVSNVNKSEINEIMGNILSTNTEDKTDSQENDSEINETVSESEVMDSADVSKSNLDDTKIQKPGSSKEEEGEVEQFTKNLSAQDINLIIMGKPESIDSPQEKVTEEEICTTKLETDDSEDFEDIVKSLETAIVATEKYDSNSPQVVPKNEDTELTESKIDNEKCNSPPNNDVVDVCVNVKTSNPKIDDEVLSIDLNPKIINVKDGVLESIEDKTEVNDPNIVGVEENIVEIEYKASSSMKIDDVEPISVENLKETPILDEMEEVTPSTSKEEDALVEKIEITIEEITEETPSVKSEDEITPVVIEEDSSSAPETEMTPEMTPEITQKVIDGVVLIETVQEIKETQVEIETIEEEYKPIKIQEPIEETPLEIEEKIEFIDESKIEKIPTSTEEKIDEEIQEDLSQINVEVVTEDIQKEVLSKDRSTPVTTGDNQTDSETVKELSEKAQEDPINEDIVAPLAKEAEPISETSEDVSINKSAPKKPDSAEQVQKDLLVEEKVKPETTEKKLETIPQQTAKTLEETPPKQETKVEPLEADTGESQDVNNKKESQGSPIAQEDKLEEPKLAICTFDLKGKLESPKEVVSEVDIVKAKKEASAETGDKIDDTGDSSALKVEEMLQNLEESMNDPKPTPVAKIVEPQTEVAQAPKAKKHTLETEPEPEKTVSPPKKIKLVRDKPKLVRSQPTPKKVVVVPKVEEKPKISDPEPEPIKEVEIPKVATPEPPKKETPTQPEPPKKEESEDVEIKAEESDVTSKSKQKLKLTRNYKIPKQVLKKGTIVKGSADQDKVSPIKLVQEISPSKSEKAAADLTASENVAPLKIEEEKESSPVSIIKEEPISTNEKILADSKITEEKVVPSSVEEIISTKNEALVVEAKHIVENSIALSKSVDEDVVLLSPTEEKVQILQKHKPLADSNIVEEKVAEEELIPPSKTVEPIAISVDSKTAEEELVLPSKMEEDVPTFQKDEPIAMESTTAEENLISASVKADSKAAEEELVLPSSKLVKAVDEVILPSKSEESVEILQVEEKQEKAGILKDLLEGTTEQLKETTTEEAPETVHLSQTSTEVAVKEIAKPEPEVVEEQMEATPSEISTPSVKTDVIEITEEISEAKPPAATKKATKQAKKKAAPKKTAPKVVTKPLPIEETVPVPENTTKEAETEEKVSEIIDLSEESVKETLKDPEVPEEETAPIKRSLRKKAVPAKESTIVQNTVPVETQVVEEIKEVPEVAAPVPKIGGRTLRSQRHLKEPLQVSCESPKFDQTEDESGLKIVSVRSTAQEETHSPITVTKPLQVDVNTEEVRFEKGELKLTLPKQRPSPKIRIKPIVKPPDEPTSSKAVENVPKVTIKPVMKPLDPLKITITKQSGDHSILKIYKPEDQQAEIPKLTIKSVPKPEETQAQHSPRRTTRNIKILSPGITVKPIETQEVNYPKVTIKPVLKPEEKASSLSPRQKIKALESSGITMEPVVRQGSPLRISIKPIPKEEASSSNISKPITKTCEIVHSDSKDGISSPLKLTIKPISSEQTYQSPKLTIKPVLKPEEVVEDEKQERIVLKIQKSNLPSPKERPTKEEPEPSETDKNEKLGKIKLKLTKEGSHAQIIPSKLTENPLKRALVINESGIVDKRMKNDPESDVSINIVEQKEPKSMPTSINNEVTIEKVDNSPSTSGSMLSRALTSPMQNTESKFKDMLLQIQQKTDITCTQVLPEAKEESTDSDDVKIVGIIPPEGPKQDSISINESSNSEDVVIISEVPVAVEPDPVEPEEIPVVLPPVPKKRGRPRKNPIEVKPEASIDENTEIIEIAQPPKEKKQRGGYRPRGSGRGGKTPKKSPRGGRKGKYTPKRQNYNSPLIIDQITLDESNDEFSTPSKFGHNMHSTPMREPGKLYGIKGGEPFGFEEETRMSYSENNSRAQTPARQFAVPPGYEGPDESQSSMHSTATTESNRNKKGRMEIQDVDSHVTTVEQIAEYYWKDQGPFMLQEQIAQYLGVKSFKRKYPGLSGRRLEMQERDYIREQNLVSESLCDMGLTAVPASEILDIMYTDFQEKYEEYRKYQRDKQSKEISNKQKAISLANTQEKSKLDFKERAIQDAANWNQNFNRTRQESRKCFMDLQTYTINYPQGKIKVPQKPAVGHYPVALVPGQFTDYYKHYTPSELNYFPLNTVRFGPVFPNQQYYNEDGSDGSGSDSDSSSGSDSDSSDSDSSSSGDESPLKPLGGSIASNGTNLGEDQCKPFSINLGRVLSSRTKVN